MYFLHQIKHTNGNYEKGVVIKETFDDAKQGYHAYLGAYAYGHDANTDFVSVEITDDSPNFNVLLGENWNAPVEPASAE